MFRKKQNDADELIDGAEAIDAEDEVLEPDDEYEDDEYETDDEQDEDEEDDEPHERDALVGWMTLLSVLLVLVVVGATASVVFFLLGMRGAPRTATERLITSSEMAAQEVPSAESLRSLAYAYLSAGRYAEALDTVEKSRKMGDTSDADLAQADILRMQKKYEQAITLYKKAATRNNKEVEKAQKELEKRGIFSPPSRTTYVSIMIGEGESFAALGQKTQALAAYKQAVKYDGTNAFALARLGDLSLDLGKKKEAKAAYEEALRFIPDYEPATKGLARLSGTKE